MDEPIEIKTEEERHPSGPFIWWGLITLSVLYLIGVLYFSIQSFLPFEIDALTTIMAIFVSPGLLILGLSIACIFVLTGVRQLVAGLIGLAYLIYVVINFIAWVS